MIFLGVSRSVYGQNDPNPVSAPESSAEDCHKLAGNKEWKTAAQCFLNEVKKLKKLPKLTAEAKENWGLYLRNAAQCLDNSAKQEKTLVSKYALREKALRILQRSINKKLCSRPDCLLIKSQQGKVRAKTPYAFAEVHAQHPKAKICITGYYLPKKNFYKTFSRHQLEQKSFCKKGKSFRLKGLYPGRSYTASILYPNQQKQIHLFKNLKLPGAIWKVKLSTLTLLTPFAGVKIKLSGDLLLGKGSFFTNKLKKSLLPGLYRLSIQLSKKKTIQKDFLLKPKQSLTYNIVQLKTYPSGARVYAKRALVGKTPVSLLYQAGTNQQLLLKKPCYLPKKIQFRVTDKVQKLDTFSFKRDPIFLNATRSYGRRKVVGWVVLGSSLVFGGASSIFHILANDRQNQALSHRQTDGDRYEKLAKEGNTFRLIGHAGVGLGVIAVGIGFSTLLLNSKPNTTNLKCQVLPSKRTK